MWLIERTIKTGKAFAFPVYHLPLPDFTPIKAELCCAAYDCRFMPGFPYGRRNKRIRSIEC